MVFSLGVLSAIRRKEITKGGEEIEGEIKSDMTLEFKKERLEMMKDIYEGGGNVSYLEKKFGDRCGEILEFLFHQKFIQSKECLPPVNEPGSRIIRLTGDTISWRLTVAGTEYYEKEMEKKHTTSSISIHASNSAVSFQSPNSQQSLHIDQVALTPETLDLLQQLNEAIKSDDAERKESLLQKLKGGAENVFWNLVASGLYSVLTQK